MNNKNTGIIATIAAVLLCGCPGLFMCFWGATFAFAGMTPGAEIDVMGSSDPTAAIATGLGTICASLIFILIPVAVGFFTLRKKPEAVSSESLPPAS